MSRDNISEMAKVMCGRDKDCILCPIQSPCSMRNCAELLNAEGYRKASDVAREIFAEIEHTARSAVILLKFEKNEEIRNTKTECYTDLIGYIAELKKEYIGDKQRKEDGK